MTSKQDKSIGFEAELDRILKEFRFASVEALRQNHSDDANGINRQSWHKAKQAILELHQTASKEAELKEAQLLENRMGQRFDELCKRVRTEPHLGNTNKHKKDNFLDGAETMLIVPSVRRAEIEAQLNQKEGSE